MDSLSALLALAALKPMRRRFAMRAAG